MTSALKCPICKADIDCEDVADGINIMRIFFCHGKPQHQFDEIDMYMCWDEEQEI